MARLVVRVTAREVCDPAAATFSLDVGHAATIGDVKRALHCEKPAWAPEKQVVAREGSRAGPLGDGAPAAGGALLCWVACVCQRRPVSRPFQFVPPGYALGPAAGPAAGAASGWDDVID